MGKLYLIGQNLDTAVVGALGAYLGRLARANMRIVNGFIIPVDEEIQFGLSSEILRLFDHFDNKNATIRSSSVNPDIFSNETIRNVSRNNLVNTIDYLQKNSIRRGENAAVVVQEDINAECSGTVHSYNPVTLDSGEVLIEANLWMNNTVLTGESDTDMILVNKNTGALNLESEEEDEICLTPGQISQLYNMVRKVEKLLNEAISVDWAFDNGILYILNARPITAKTYERYK